VSLRTPSALALLLAAAPAAAGLRPVYGGEIRVALPSGPRDLDPARAADPADLAAARALHAPPLRLDAAGTLAPGLLVEVPSAEAGGRAFRLRLRQGLQFADGAPLGASDLAAALVRLALPATASPHAWIALPIQGMDAVTAGRAQTASGIQVLSDRELLVMLAFPLPEFPFALAALGAAPVSPRGGGAGPFRLVAREGEALRLAANDLCPDGRPFADGLVLSAREARSAARGLERGELELAVRPEGLVSGATALAPTRATYAAVNRRRLGPAAEPLRRALSALDRAELVRLFVRGPAAPLGTLLPASILPGPPALPAAAIPAAALPAAAPPERVKILVRAGVPDERPVAERIQVKLFDRGVRAAVESADPVRFAARLTAGDYDVALVTVDLAAARPALAAGQIALAVAGPDSARRAMAEMAGLEGEAAAAAADRIARALEVVPLFVAGLRASAAPALQGLVPRSDGGFEPGDLWLLPRAAR
jgi:peptide/nickel transport system substrate-binding protein